MKCECRIQESFPSGLHYISQCPLCKAAPELLEHLKDMVRRFEGCLTVNGTDREFARNATVHARAAIAKADCDPVPFSSPSLEPSYNELMLEKQARRRKKR